MKNPTGDAVTEKQIDEDQETINRVSIVYTLTMIKGCLHTL